MLTNAKHTYGLTHGEAGTVSHLGMSRPHLSRVRMRVGAVSILDVRRWLKWINTNVAKRDAGLGSRRINRVSKVHQAGARF